LASLALLVGAPAIVTAVIIALVQIRATLTHSYGAEANEPAWAGARPEAVKAAGVPSKPDLDPTTSESQAQASGGASARW
jgi:hypothetical protein